MADVRFLRHLRDANRTTLVRGKKVNKHAAVEARLEAAKSGGSSLLETLENLTSKGKKNKSRHQDTEKKYTWLREAQRLRDMSRYACVHVLECVCMYVCIYVYVCMYACEYKADRGTQRRSICG